MLHHFLSGEGETFLQPSPLCTLFLRMKIRYDRVVFLVGAELNVTADEGTVAGQTKH